ncbi:S8 family serine peptidase [Nocardia sp. NPDC055053]
MLDNRGAGVTIGLLEGDYSPSVADLEGAHITVRRFGARDNASQWLCGHGSFSASLLVGQGNAKLLGTVPAARLLIACTASPNGMSQPDTVAEALTWLAAEGASVIAIPLGQYDEHPGLADALRTATDAGALVLAAAGNCAPRPIMFPARDPHCLAVGACTAAGALLPNCATSPRLDIIARGHRVIAPIHGRAVRRRSGTSASCVLAAGLIAASVSAHGSWFATPTIPADPMSRQHSERCIARKNDETIRRVR